MPRTTLPTLAAASLCAVLASAAGRVQAAPAVTLPGTHGPTSIQWR